MIAAPRRMLVAGLAGLALVLAPAAAADLADERALAERFAPVVRLVEQDAECGPGEPYDPLDVELLLDDEPTVALRGPWNPSDLAKIGPAAADLVNRFEYHLDFPGNPLDAKCDYERWARHLAEGSTPTVYAHVATQTEYPDSLALQYWLFYAFNDFNNTHEGDWEMIQLVFDADDAREALETEPREVGYSAHEGAERATWGDDKLELVDETHPVVFPGAGSHANKFTEALYLGSSAEAGVGCDDTRGPHRELRPKVVTIPSEPSAAKEAFPWIGFEGRWGELQPAFFNGPTGPNMKHQWLEPFRWMSGLRTSTPTVPTNETLGEPVTGFFCGAVSSTSSLLNDTSSSPLTALLVFATIAAAFAIPALRTQWRPVVSKPVRQRRAGGQIVDAAARVYRDDIRVLAPVGLVAVPLGGLAVAAQLALFHSTGLRRAFDALGDDKVEAVVALLVGGLAHAIAPMLVGAATVLVVRDLDRGGEAGLRVVLRGLRGELWRLVGLGFAGLIVVLLLVLTVIGIPYALKKAVDWAFVQQVAGFEDRRGRDAFRGSRNLVRGHWWRVALITSMLLLVLIVTGPFLGVLVIFVTDAPLATINFFGTLLFALVLPFTSVALSLLYLDLAVRRDSEEPSTGMLPAP